MPTPHILITATLPKCKCGEPLIIDYHHSVYLMDINEITAHAQCKNPTCQLEETSIYIIFRTEKD